MSPVTLSTVLRRRSDVRYRRIEGEAVVLRQSAAEVLVLNEIGASVLDLADGDRPVREWIDALAEEYEADPATLARDVLEFAGELQEAGLLEAVEIRDAQEELER
jgi:Coenzyme PQQ synthesis protein D (PqqD)